MSELAYTGCSLAVVAAWLAVYRLPFGDPARRRRVAMWLADRTGFRPDPAFAVFATVLYLSLGLATFFSLLRFSGVGIGDVFSRPTPSALLDLLLAILGTSSLNILCVSLLYRARPTVDVPGEIARIQWIASILSLPRHHRWLIPAAAALVEEAVFRGAVLLGLIRSGASFPVACAFSTLLFAAGQIVLVSTPVQAFVLGSSSVVLGTMGSLLVASTGSLVPAAALHMSFAGLYTSMSTGNASASRSRRAGL